VKALLLAELLVPRGPEVSQDLREPLTVARTLVLLGSVVRLLVALARLWKAKGVPFPGPLPIPASASPIVPEAARPN
jgi:hypothetical protein